MKKKSKASFLSKKNLLLAMVAVATLAGVVFVLEKTHIINLYEQEGAAVQDGDGSINYGPPTEEEKQAGNDAKEQIIQKEAQQNASQSQTGLKSVVPVISYASRTEVNAYVPGVFEDGGECSATFTQGATSVNRSSQGFANVSDTQCAPISPNLPNSGSWTVVVSYKSATSSGSSTTVEVSQ